MKNFKNKESFVFYDFPRLFTATDDDNNLYLGMWVEDDDKTCTWIYVPTNENIIEQLKSKEIDIRDAFLKGPSQDCHIIKDLLYGCGKTLFIEKFLISELEKKDWLPDQGINL